jgi:hypothetical protein
VSKGYDVITVKIFGKRRTTILALETSENSKITALFARK